MKKILFFLLVPVLPVAGLQAQSLSDDITQLVLDVQKLSQMKQILSDMYQGYTVVSKGYEDIKNLSQGTFSLHKVFLDELLAVSPAVASYAKVADILTKETNLVKEYQSARNYFQGTGRFTSQELDYFSGVYGNLFNGSLKNVNELLMIITANQLRMSDAERLTAIERIDKDITGQLSFLRSFDNNTGMQALQRGKSTQDISTMQALYGVSP